ncbi:MAG: efflux transporter periplasmic adaptor subunit [Gimesia sp.]|nr:efflux transporter periplasmic adaptor subunit [Gimesia sp.]|tara:strand:- start:10217 stop:11734 length:1518 start_codon:yes stop_codon:yes gene_type:complete
MMNVDRIENLWCNKHRMTALMGYGLLAVAVGAAGMYAVTRAFLTEPVSGVASTEARHGVDDEHGEDSYVVTLAKDKWAVAGLRIAEVASSNLTRTEWITGKVALNEDRLAHVYSLVDGQIHEVKVQFGDDVKQGQVLAVIDSKEVGLAKLDLYKDRLDAEFAKINYEFMREINENTQALIKVLIERPPLEKIGATFDDKQLGKNRQQLMTAYANLYKSRADYERLTSVAESGVVAGKLLIEAKARFEADQATFQSLLEQLKFTASQEALLAEQKLQQAEQTVAASRSRLLILGYQQDDLKSIDPIKEGEMIAHYELRAPFDGTVIGKNVVLAERVGPDTEMFQVADLSTLWVQADIYQKDLPKTRQLGETLRFRSPDSDHLHEARIFYTGDILDPETRTVRLRATIDNPDRHLKPGMFVEIALPGETLSNIVTLPASAIQEVEGHDVVFVQTGLEAFEKRKVKVGIRSGDTVQIRDGLQPGNKVVVVGGFALKSELMKGSISHGH